MFTKKIINWYLDNYRKLPWRETKNPYKIWLSEIILQQTRVAQGLPYYEKFTINFPTVEDLANAEEQTVLKLWEGLGYYSRARNLHFSAKYIVNELNGVFPNSYKTLLTLKGVGEYTAAAIASFAYKEQVAAIDGNVYRVLSRFFGIATAIDSGEGKKQFKELANKLIDSKNPDIFNQALMEFGATVCKPKLPLCDSCIFNNSCFALAHKKIQNLPYKKGKTKVRMRYFNYLVFLDNNKHTIIKQRQGKGIWQNLYEFPLFETNKTASEEDIKQHLIANYKEKNTVLYNENPIVHKLSHQHLYTHFWIVETTALIKKSIAWEGLKNYPFPVLIDNFLKKFNPNKNN